MNTRKIFLTLLFSLLVSLFVAGSAAALEVTVTIENLAPENGNFLTPFWVGFHDGDFDTYDRGVAASPELERIAEDGNTGPLSDAFASSSSGSVDATLLGPNGPIAPGESATMTFNLDPRQASSRFFSYASMVIPSNDAFVSNGNPQAHEILDARGNFRSTSFVIQGGDVLDAGTEVNDEAPANTAFFGQAAPDTGTSENGVIGAHPGFLAAGSGGILDDAQFSNATFNDARYNIARVTITATIDVLVTIENLAPANGNYLTPVWVGFHDGSFDLWDRGAAATEGLERIAEDGNTAPLSAEFLASGAGMVDGVVPGPNGPIAPGETARGLFQLDGSRAYNRFFTFASMVLPSNDALISDGRPTAIPVFDARGNFVGGSFIVYGNEVLDAGTEVNAETPATTAFFGQASPNTGADENGTVQPHPGFLLPGAGGILDDAMFANADFTVPGYRMARITIQEVGGTSLRLHGDRFLVSARFAAPDDGAAGFARGLRLTEDSGTFYFFTADNVELVVKVLDGCSFNNRFWVFTSGLTNVEVELTVEDLEGGESRTYLNPQGRAFEPIQDTNAFATCP